jgi:hypothetical protein
MQIGGPDNPLAGVRPAQPAPWGWLTARWAGALALLAVGIVHLQQYLETYSAIPTIGTLFALNFVGATVLGLALLAPIERMTEGGLLLALVALGGIALAAVAFVFLAVSERTTLFGFHEPGYAPTAIAVSRVAELATVALLSAYVIARFVAGTSMRRW